MTDTEVLALLLRIDDGYMPTNSEKEELSNISKITWKGIENIPVSINLLIQLIELDVSGTLFNVSGLTSIPDSIGNLTSLQDLNLSYTQISSLPDSIWNLTSLHSLYLRSTKISSLPESIGKLTRLQNLDLSYTQLNEIPESIWNLTNLQSLALSHTKINKLPLSIGNLTNLQSLALSHTKINRLPLSIGNLKNLEYFDLSYTSVSRLPVKMMELKNLKTLKLNSTQIRKFPEVLEKLTGLQNLNLSLTEVAGLTQKIRNLKNLKSLDVSGTQISMLSTKIDDLVHLEKLNLSNTRIGKLPGSIAKLKNLEYLNLSATRIDVLPARMCELTNLRYLNLYATRISELPECIDNLEKLQEIDLRFTQIKELPESIGSLRALEQLLLENCSLYELPESLLYLNLEYKKEKYNVRNRNESGIYIYGLKLKNQPVEIFSQDRDLIRAYYREHDMVPVNECKVVFLGDPEAGKTHAIKRLMRKGEKLKEFENQSTPGIEITVDTMQMEDSSIIVNYWDFGGQEIQHSMHRMFLTERTIYVVFLNARQDPLDDRARYWLENICSFAKDAPVLLVINKMDQNERPKFNEDGIRKDYRSQIKKIVRMSALEDEPKVFMDELQGSINDIIRELPTVSSKVPQSWKNLMEDIRTMPDHYLTTKQFKERCSACSVGDYDTIHDELVDLFQVIGISFCYYTNRALADYMLLNPKWLVNAIYTIISNSKVAAHNGVITQNDLYDLLKEDTLHGVPIRRVIPELRYESYQVNYILGVIRMFRLSYPMKDGSEFFPMLCDGNEKITVDKVMSENALHYIFRYTYLPANVMHRLVVEMQRDLKEEYVWYSGAVFRNDYQKQIAYIHTKGNDLHIYVDALDSYYNPNEYLTPIQNIVRAINIDMNLSAEEYVTHREGDTDAEIDAEELKGNLEIGNEKIYNSKLKRAINLRDVARRFNDIRPKIKGELLPNIIKALGLMQNESACYKSSTNSHQLEDQRNRYVSSQVLMAGYNCNDQQPGGPGKGRKQAGERDIVFRNKSGQDILIYEGLNLTGFNKKNIDVHLHKLMENYNPQGLPYGVLVSYVDCDRTRFNEITVTYRDHITDVAPENYVCIGQPRNIPTIGQYLKCIEMDYECGGQYFTIYHILVGMVEQM